MRTISSASLDMLATRLGTEPINIVEVEWNTGKRLLYADRTVEGIPGKIQSIGTVDTDIDISTGTSQSVEIKLEDYDGSIKTIFDNTDIHLRRAWLWQYFDGLDLDDKFLIFQGRVNSPISWSEGDRTVTFTILNQLEDKEIGFSAEEGDFPYLPWSMVGKAWPIIFGTVLDVPALQVNTALQGTTLCGIGAIDGADLQAAVPIGGDECGFFFGLAQQQAQLNHLEEVASCFGGVQGEQYNNQVNKLREQIGNSLGQHAQQDFCARQQRAQTLADAEATGRGCNPVKILGGEDFPQNKPIQLAIGGGLFTGIMRSNEFTVSSATFEDAKATAQQAAAKTTSYQCRNGSGSAAPKWSFTTQVPCTCSAFNMGEVSGSCFIHNEGAASCIDVSRTQPTVDQVAQHSWVEPGTSVTLASNQPITFIVSIVPGTVLAVKAYKTFQGPRKLVNVPNDLYTIQVKDYGPVTAVQIICKKPLSYIKDQGWEDQIYVTFKSDVGPNTCDILEYIIDRWTSLDSDSTSFNHVRTLIDPFPMNFPILDRRNTIDVLKDIAFQGRCALWLDEENFKIKYLPEEPDVDEEITVSDIKTNTLSVELTETEKVVTKEVVKYHLSWADGTFGPALNDPKPDEIVLRHNVNKYGTKQQDYDFYCFNNVDVTMKSATFWLIRNANTWKLVKFQTHLNKLNLEPYDTVLLPAGYVSTDPVKAIVQTATYNSDDHAIDFTVMTPVKAGEMAPYKFFWPKDVSDEWPTKAEIKAGNAGGQNTIAVLPIGSTDGIGQSGTIFVGGPNILFLANSGRGDNHPGDIGFVVQQLVREEVYAQITNAKNPNPWLKLNYKQTSEAPPQMELGDHETIIDIHRTFILDSHVGPGGKAKLDTLIEKVKDNNLFLKGTVNVTGGGQDGTFEYKWDSDGGKFGAERAFLVEGS